MSSAGDKAAKEGGFTLLELLVVMLIVSLSVVAIAAALPGTASGPSVELAAARLAAGFKKARMRAISGGTVVTVAVDPDNRLYRIGSTGPVVRLPGNIAIAPLRSTVVRFFPDGGADPGAIRLTADQRTRRVEVSPMTGQVTLR